MFNLPYLENLLNKKNSPKAVFLFITWLILITIIFKLQSNYKIIKTELQLNENSLEFAKNEIAAKNLKFIKLKEIENTSTFKLKSSIRKTVLPVIESTICNVSRPNFSDLRFDNIYWQTLNNSNGTVKLFSAFYDDRSESKIGPSIRIIALVNGTDIENFETFCQFWFDEIEKPIVSKTIEYQLIWYKEWGFLGNFLPFLITCPYKMNDDPEVPQAVSMVNKDCDQAENYLKILNYRPKFEAAKKPFAVCVKALNFDDESVAFRIVEWIELLRILGADKIFIYQFHFSKTIRTVFDYYERYGILEVVKIFFPKNLPAKRWPNQVISLNDCFYRNLYLYDYIGIFDIDEILMPTHPDDMSWLDMLQRINQNLTNSIYASYNFQNTYFVDHLQHNVEWHSDIPHYLHILHHFIRLVNHTVPKYSIKSFYNTNVIKTVLKQYPVSCLHGHCNGIDVDTHIGYIAHYRRVRTLEAEESAEFYRNHTVVDKTVWKYKDQLIKQSTKVVNMLNLTYMV